MPTQTAIDNLVDELVRVYSGHSIAFPNGSYPNQCTVPVAAHYIPRITGQAAPSMYRDRADGWGEVFPYQLSSFFTHVPYQPGTAYPKGSIMMWNSPHIAIVLSHDGSNIVRVFQQNADPDGAPCQVSNRVINNQFHTCTYVLIPIIQAPAPPAPTGPPYRTENITSKEVVLNKDTFRYGLNHASFDQIDADRLAPAAKGARFTTSTKLYHQCGEVYYSQANSGYSVANGFNVKDCDDYVAPIVAPTLSAPSAAPLIPKPAEKYTLVTTIMAFQDAPSAQGHKGQATALGIHDGIDGTAEFYVWETVDKAKLLGISNMKRPSPETWINVRDNVVEEVKPAPEPVLEVKPVEQVPTITPTVITEVAAPPEPPKQETDMATQWKVCTPIKVNPNTGQWIPVKYRSTNDMVVNIRSLDGKQPATLPLPPHRELSIVSTFTGPDGETYARDDLLTTSHRFYALRFDMLEKVVPPAVVRHMDVNHDGRANIEDITTLMYDYGNKYFKPGLAIATRTVQTVKKSKFVDGIVAGATKKRNKVQ